jgi:DNA-binding NarL/FixJ family response regulator
LPSIPALNAAIADGAPASGNVCWIGTWSLPEACPASVARVLRALGIVAPGMTTRWPGLLRAVGPLGSPPGVHHHRVQGPPLRVVIAEDSVLIREGIARLIEESGGTVVAKVGDGEAFVDAVVEQRPDVSVVDVRMPPSQRDEGLRAAIEARRRVPGTPILVLSQYVERQYATELLADGAGGVGYLLKDRVGDIPEFMDALRRVARGGTALDAEVVAQLMVRNRADDPLSALTPREREVLAAMAEGRTNVGIARLLGISEGATEKHISNIFGKLQLPDSPDDHRRVLAVLAQLGS